VKRGRISSLYRIVIATFRGLFLYGSLAFVTYVGISNLRSLPEGVLSLNFILVIVVLGFLYPLLLVLIAVAWGCFLRGFGVAASWREIIVVFGRANLAKYIPGNVFEFVGRQLMGNDRRWSNFAVLCSTILEILIIVFASALVTLAMLIIAPVRNIPAEGSIFVVAALVVGMLVLGALFITSTWKFLPFGDLIGRATVILYSPALPVALVLYLVFFFVLGQMVVATLYGITGHWVSGLSQPFTLAYTAAWFIGYITPGAPGGLGVREAALVVLLGPSLGDATALSVAAGLRCLTILGDLVLFAACHCHTSSFRNPWRR
jgi:glycosyltransferase 2 family protein